MTESQTRTKSRPSKITQKSFKSSSPQARKKSNVKRSGAKTSSFAKQSLNKKVRLQKYLSDCGISSRRSAEELIEQKRVSVNGEIATLGMSVTPGVDEIFLDGKQVKQIEHGVAIFNKPDGVVSTMSDPQGRRSIADFLPEHLKSYFPVGRLDYESIGLVVLTNDGDLADRLLHPKYNIPRKYHIRVKGIPNKSVLAQAERGVKLDDGVVKASVRFLREVEGACWLEVVIHVGKNRVVRRMFEKLGYPVKLLQRVAHGPFNLGDLKRGEIKELSPRQYRRTREMIFKGFTSFGEKKTKRSSKGGKTGYSRSSPRKKLTGKSFRNR